MMFICKQPAERARGGGASAEPGKAAVQGNSLCSYSSRSESQVLHFFPSSFFGSPRIKSTSVSLFQVLDLAKVGARVTSEKLQKIM